jgi:catechol 2,3-dioxygenase-like lactoylglutathione lyase family enzyme
MNIEHVALNHPDPARAAQWYVEHLGMEIVRSSDQSPFIHFLADTAKTGLIELYNNPDAEVPDYPSQSPLIVHIAFSTDDLEGTQARLIEAGATAEGGITKTPAGDQLAMLRDPWGVPLQLAKRAKPMV